MTAKKNFGISDKVMNLWYAVNRKYGQHAYVIGVTGQGKLVLSKGYVNRIAEGTRDVTAMLNELLNK